MQGSLCRLTGSGDPIWVRTYLDLPAGINGPDGRPVNDHLLTFGEWAGPFSPTHYLDRKPGKLRFEIPPDAIEYLLRPGRNETLSGNITVIWDSQV